MIKLVVRFILIFIITIQSLFPQSLKYQADEVVFIIKTTSKNKEWSPQTVTKTGQPLTWKASATGMADQVVTTLNTPAFDLSVNRTSDVTITVTSPDGASGLTELRIVELNITSVEFKIASGIQKFNCSNNQLKELDVSKNSELINLNCNSNYKIKELIVGTNRVLETLICFYNEIEDLDLLQNNKLTSLSCGSNKLKDLDLTANISLTSLECDNNSLGSLNVQNGNNVNMNFFNSTNNKELKCIQVDDETANFSNWQKDSWAQYNNDCTFANRPPMANDDLYSTTDNTVLNISYGSGVLINDSDHEDKPLTAILITGVSNGSLQLDPNGSFTYTPDKNFYGTDQFTYKANDGELDSSPATVTIHVNLMNQKPIAEADFYRTIENVELIISKSTGLLTNDGDADNDMLTVKLENDVINGVLNLLPDGSFTYLPNVDFYGEDFFTYKTFDGFEYSLLAEVNIEVEAINEIIVPNAFSPNDDQINDNFRPVYKGMVQVRLEIYDTWGNLIFFEEGKNITGWNGTLKGTDAENGNYMFKITAETYDNQIIVRDGVFILIK